MQTKNDSKMVVRWYAWIARGDFGHLHNDRLDASYIDRVDWQKYATWIIQ